MVWHCLKYELLQSIRVKDVIVWLILFPILLGAFFKIAFHSIYDKTTHFSTIPVAVVEQQEDSIFHTVMDSLETGDDPLFAVTYTDSEEAKRLLKEDRVKGIIFLEDTLSLTVSKEGMEQTMIHSFLNQYQTQEAVLVRTMQTHPEQLDAVLAVFQEDLACNKAIPLTDGNPDNYIAYFYNLLAMVAMFGSITGLHVAIGSQGNLSALGARRCCSPTPKSISLITSLIGSYGIQTLCILISVTYLAFVLQVDFGNRLPLVYLSGCIGGILGVSMGFMIGSFSRISQGAKVGIAMTISMLSCFFSGMMIGNMKAILAEKLPWFNRINPAALISDAFYCLNVYQDYDRYLEKNVSMLILAVLFVTIGILLTRRRKYASL